MGISITVSKNCNSKFKLWTQDKSLRQWTQIKVNLRLDTNTNKDTNIELGKWVEVNPPTKNTVAENFQLLYWTK